MKNKKTYTVRHKQFGFFTLPDLGILEPEFCRFKSRKSAVVFIKNICKASPEMQPEDLFIEPYDKGLEVLFMHPPVGNA